MIITSIGDLEFDRIPLTRYTSSGEQFTAWSICGMPRIHDGILNSTFFLYKTYEDAERGSGYGGTGFYVYMHSEVWGSEISYFYAITNKHVAVTDGYPIIRMNKVDGTSEILNIDSSEWIFDHSSDDIAIYQLPPLKLDDYLISPITTELIPSKEKIKKLGIGIGEDVFIIGRFADKDSSENNQPTARFGHISSMPSPAYNRALGKCVYSYFIDMSTQGGYSGSPVFAYRTPGTNLGYMLENGRPDYNSSMFILLGIHWGQFPEELPIHGKFGKKEGENAIGKSGMGLTVPSWSILQLLQTKELVEMRKKYDEEWGIKFAEERYPRAPILESHAPSTHQEDF